MASSNIDDIKFMSLARLESEKSADPVTKVGACLVTKNNEIISLGYNRMPSRDPQDEDKFSWNKDKHNYLDNKHNYVCHAELNAIKEMARTELDTKGCRIYVTLFPCNNCAELIIQFGVSEVIYLEDKNKSKYYSSRTLLDVTGIPCRQLKINHYNSKHEMFMHLANLVSEKSPMQQKVGACLVGQNDEIISWGYNSYPDQTPEAQRKSVSACHATLNTIKELVGTKLQTNWCRLYCTRLPCCECAKLIVQFGISEVIYYGGEYTNENEYKAALHMFKQTGILFREMQPAKK